jgi:hypothetical protein
LLSFKVFYGMGERKGQDGQTQKAPDPNKVLFYQSPDGSCFDCAQQEWVSPPSILDHLPSREIMHDEKGHDILRAIASGIVDDDDYQALNKAGLVNDDGKRVYELYKKTLDYSDKLATLEKSEAPEQTEEESESMDLPESSEGESEGTVTKQGVDVVATFMDVAGVQKGIEQAREEYGEKGVDLIVQIMEAALGNVDQKTMGFVQEEVTRQVAPLVRSMEQIMQSMGLQGQEMEDQFAPETYEGQTEDELP